MITVHGVAAQPKWSRQFCASRKENILRAAVDIVSLHM